jgi:hypothetical protein
VSERLRTGVGRVFHENRLVAEVMPYELRVDAWHGEPLYARLRYMPPGIPDGGALVLELEDGRRMPCHRLDNTDVCAMERE